MMGSPIGTLLIMLVGIAGAVLAIVFVAVPLFQGIGQLIGGLFRAIGWLIAHFFEFVIGVITDTLRFIGAIPTLMVFSVLALVQVLIGRWSAANHYSAAVVNECKVGAGCLYRVALRRPLKLIWCHGLLEGMEQRVPQVFEAAPTADLPSKTTGQFDGYTIVGSLRSGGSGAKLYVARPEERKRSALPGKPDLVVIKSFAITDGSSLPQIIRESRALECAKSMGHVLDHGMDAHRFHYVMPYIPGDNLGMAIRQLHGEGDTAGLDRPALATVMSYAGDVVATLEQFHSCGLWHKDVKPENIIVHDRHAHIVDLGLLTPLQSAMTLTTHGTEYFRDPEMVRQALRGVKVHQVDGAKFDVYGAGAVLYFMLENTFPAHGALSAFSRKSPEALRWIVKRAMTDYAKRYESAAAMLADLRCVQAAADPYAVRPADLPSVKAGDSPMPIPAPNPMPFPGIAAAAAIPAAAFGAATPQGSFSSGKPTRPRLRVVDWLTGRYVVEDLGLQGAAAPAAVAASPRWQPISGPIPTPVAERLASARHRANALQDKARADVARACARRHTRVSKVLWTIALLVLATPVALIAMSQTSVQIRPSAAPSIAADTAGDRVVVVVEDSDDIDDILDRINVNPGDEPIQLRKQLVIDEISDDDELDALALNASQGNRAALARLDKIAADHRAGSVIVVPSRGGIVVRDLARNLQLSGVTVAGRSMPLTSGLNLALVNTHLTPMNPKVLDRLDGVVSMLGAQGVITDRSCADAAAELSVVLPRWKLHQDGAAAAVDEILNRYHLDGVLWIDSPSGVDPAPDRWSQAIIVANHRADPTGDGSKAEVVSTSGATAVSR